MCRLPPWVPTLFSLVLLPLGLDSNSLHTRQKYRQREKKYQDTKALYVTLSSGIDFFSSSLFDRQHEIVASCHVEQEFRDCIGSSSITEFWGRAVSLATFCIEASSICYLFVVVAFKQ